nr:immunoglobulin heavy chain junction region [Macaca mulatta]MOX38808.1 immunoglobulin heavy chain junction region [Macaca mulatta]MOX39108.1 immunoglobulin heavy chain junction region [Macaca mulatta]MOX39738.1 immunoglobulin heavy chain junction region [Macaca mulatta]MOX40556.1 immunoglobulin heavy chain junction region [Macaca mulatta]
CARGPMLNTVTTFLDLW